MALYTMCPDTLHSTLFLLDSPLLFQKVRGNEQRLELRDLAPSVCVTECVTLEESWISKLQPLHGKGLPCGSASFRNTVASFRNTDSWDWRGGSVAKSAYWAWRGLVPSTYMLGSQTSVTLWWSLVTSTTTRHKHVLIHSRRWDIHAHKTKKRKRNADSRMKICLFNRIPSFVHIKIHEAYVIQIKTLTR